MVTDRPGTEPPVLLTVEQVIALTGFSEATVRRLIARRELPSVKVGALRRVARTDLDEWIARLPRAEPRATVTFTGRLAR